VLRPVSGADQLLAGLLVVLVVLRLDQPQVELLRGLLLKRQRMRQQRRSVRCVLPLLFHVVRRFSVRVVTGRETETSALAAG
jgi:hypothetical protein